MGGSNMRTRFLIAVAVCLVAAGVCAAQEHYTEGPVWTVSYNRTTPGHFDDYMKYLRSHYIPQIEEAKKEGLILDYKIFLKEPVTADDWDIAFAIQHKNMAALDYNAANDEKGRAIAEKHFATADEDAQEETIAPRFEMREFVGSGLMREVTLKPIE
jgi:hypothetical protein